MGELKPCPFCGGKAVLVHQWFFNHLAWVECGECSCRTKVFEKAYLGLAIERAVEAWNRRASDGEEAQEAVE